MQKTSASLQKPQRNLPGILSKREFEELVQKGEIESVRVGFTDHYGKLCGKTFDADFFLQNPFTACCNYLLAVDMEMNPVLGYRNFSWEKGFGDFGLVPDFSTLRKISWSEKTAFVLADVVYENQHDRLLEFAPRSMLKHQLRKFEDLGIQIFAAPELEYYVYQNTFKDLHQSKYAHLEPVGYFNEDYQLFQTSKEEKFQRAFRHHLKSSGVPVETTKGEAGCGQHELNVKYDECLIMADRHCVYKQCLKEVCLSEKLSVTFMAKPDTKQSGSSCHIHISLWKNGQNIFFHDGSDLTLGNCSFFYPPTTAAPNIDYLSEYQLECSNTFRWFLGGLLEHCNEFMVFYAPTVNSYKRFREESWAPTRIAWCKDNRTAGFRIVGEQKSLRIEIRIPGADCNIYHAFTAALASGLDGISRKIEPPPMFVGDIYEAKSLPRVPFNLNESVSNFKKSDFVKACLGEEVQQHYAHHYTNEYREYEKAVTDWEMMRYFERI